MLPLIQIQEPEGDALRWTPTTFLIDLFMAFAGVLEAIAGFYGDQARSLAARASLKEELKDRDIRQRIKTEERLRMQLHTLEDISYLPEAQE
jgi:hypothetical protein